MKKEIILPNVEASIAFAEKMAETVKKGDVFMLYGELGAGKTFFVNKLCKKIGVTEVVSSPSYVLLNEYDAKDFLVYHLDLYRLGSEEEIYELGILDFIDTGITFVEWPEIAEEMLPEERVELYFEYVEDYRKVTIIDRRKNGA